ncbi:hypothetical protein [Terriglobus aquaticus]|uniref:Uncharacterized protein n=2 Tax=Terriglobus aquaticus TaxID=940139 RepID=A0ABW9KMP2_9BACT
MVVVVAGFVAIAAAITTFVEVRGQQQDDRARAATAIQTSKMRGRFALGEPLSEAEAEVKALGLNTIGRGDDLLIIAQEGRRVWYCDHHYFGTALRFTEGKLRQIESDEWLGACL